jgi:hypothetical protein
VLAREAVLNQPEIVKLLRTRFIAIGVDNVDNLNMTAAEKAFLQDRGLKFCTQGMSVFTAGGKLLAMGGGFEPEAVKRMLVKALEKYRREEPPPVVPRRDAHDPGLIKPPEGGVVLYVSWKVLGGFDSAHSPLTLGSRTYDQKVRDAVGVDRLWVRGDEAKALAEGNVPDSLCRRILPHLTYVLAGGKKGEVKSFDLRLRKGRLTGSFQTRTGAPSRLVGLVEARDGKVTRFDLLARGMGTRVEDCGFAAGLRMVPEGRKVPVALLFSLADPHEDLARVPPHRAKHNGYLK